MTRSQLFIGLILALLIGAAAATAAHAQLAVWRPSPGHTQILLWPGAAPDAQPMAGPERGGPGEAYDVARPTLTFYRPRGGNTGAAVLVFPGGGYQMLAMGLEGTEVCDWLTAKGIACVLVKYRVPNSGPHYDDHCHCQLDPVAPMALEDAQRALGLVRHHAAEWRIDPHRIGVIGFSAGGHLVAWISTHFQTRAYAPIDAADQVSCRPDFALALYPGHLSMAANTIELRPDIASHITPQTPPTFLLQNEDDHVDSVEDAISYYMALKKAGVPAELHSYAQGGHAFGLRPSPLAVSHWPRLAQTWMAGLGIIPK